MVTALRFALVGALCLAVGCGSAEAPASVTAPETHAEPTPPAPPTPPPPPASTPTCHPIVSGCGCAYQCATGVHETSPGHWQVVHDLQDSRLDDAEIQRWCFDATGLGSPAAGPAANATRCLDVFFDGTPCGGECIPTTAYLGCHAVGDRCAP